MGSRFEHRTVFDELCEHSARSAAILAVEVALVALCLAVALLP